MGCDALKEVHFWTYTPVDKQDVIVRDYEATRMFISMPDKDVLHTSQLLFMTGELLEQGIDIWVHTLGADPFQIKLGSGNKGTDREIRASHMVWKMLLNGEFGDVV